MEEVSFDEGISRGMTSLLTDRLVLLAGAGLSMAAPSSLPSAAAIAQSAKQKYDAMFCPDQPPLPSDIDAQAQYFFERGELATVYFRTLIDKDAFAAPPNSGHYGIADLLLVRAIQTAITTNVDTMVENAAQMLFGQVAAAIDGLSAAAFRPDESPLLKLHGCRNVDPKNMVWALGQLAVPPASERIESSTNWLHGRLIDRDLLIVGYSTDWDYLNEILAGTLGTANPASVLVVDPATGQDFAQKAPALFALGQKAGVNFRQVRASGADYLDGLRRSFSKSYLRRVLSGGQELYQDKYGVAPDPAWVEPPDLANDALWGLRRDLEGCLPNKPASERYPNAGHLLGLTVIQLRARGAVAEGHHWLLDGRRIRVLEAGNKALHSVAAAYSRETAPAIVPDMVIAVGAEDDGLPSNIVRSGTTATIARGSLGHWLTRQDAIQEFGL